MSLLSSIKTFFARGEPPKFPPIILTEAGFSFLGIDSKAIELRWVNVVQIRALKLDLLAFDEVRFIFALSSGEVVEISEEQAGFEAAISTAADHFPSIAGWRHKIIAPAFARNERVLFDG